jgi:hypothetical protein
MHNVVLEPRGSTREFNGCAAVDSVDLQAQQGHIPALIGPSGAGIPIFGTRRPRLTPARRKWLHGRSPDGDYSLHHEIAPSPYSWRPNDSSAQILDCTI